MSKLRNEEKYCVYRLKNTVITEYQSAIKRDIEFVSTRYQIFMLLYLTNLRFTFEEKCFASRKGMSQDLYHIQYPL